MRIAIIGGGAAGMMAAATIQEINPKAEVFLLEKNAELGKKVLISGGGRCNVTTGIEDVTEILKKYPRGGKFVQSALRNFSPTDVRNWFESHGVPLVCEDDLRVFPVSNNGKDVVGAFEHIFSHSKITVLYNSHVEGIDRRAGGFIVSIRGKNPLIVDKVVLALGGQAYRHTGSTGDGYSLAESLGHHITQLAPSLNSFITLEKWPKKLAGVSIAKATFTANGSKRYSFTGPFLFTHLGVSGPAVFALSSLVAFEEYNREKPLVITIDLAPDFSVDALRLAVMRAVQESPKKIFKNTLHNFVPLSVAEVMCDELKIPHAKKSGEMSKQLLLEAMHWIKYMPLSVVGRGAGDEFVTAGGVELSEVNPRTMESKLVPGLCFAGEILNIDGFTGGFNLQVAWSTGRIAGENAGVV